MNTDKLIAILSSEPMHDSKTSIGLRLFYAITLGGAISFLLMFFTLGIQVNLVEKLALPQFWFKFLFAVTMLGIGLVMATKTSQPGKAVYNYSWLVGVPITGIWLIAIESARDATSTSLDEMVQGSTWKVCSLLIAYLSVPIFIAVFWELKKMAPVKPALTGFMAGLFSGALAASIYCLHCPEFSPLFVAIWYLIGILIPAILGAILSRRLLRW